MAVDLKNLESYSVSELVALVKPRVQRVHRVEAPEAENASLKQQLRASKRATAPFSNGKPNPAPNKPGRRAGEGRFEWQAMPVLSAEDRVEELHIPLDSRDCPPCRSSPEVVKQTASVDDCITTFGALVKKGRTINFHLLTHSTGGFIIREAFDDDDARDKAPAALKVRRWILCIFSRFTIFIRQRQIQWLENM
jgi:hypothetical protein